MKLSSFNISRFREALIILAMVYISPAQAFIIGSEIFGRPDPHSEYGVRVSYVSENGTISQAAIGFVNPNKTGFQRGFPELQQSDPANRVEIGKVALHMDEKIIGATSFGEPGSREEYGVRLSIIKKDGTISEATIGMINPNKTGFQRGFPELQQSDPANRVEIGKVALHMDEKIIGATSFGEPGSREEYGVRLSIIKKDGTISEATIGMINPNKTGFQRGFPELQQSDPANRVEIGKVALHMDEKIIGATSFGEPGSREEYGVRLSIIKKDGTISDATIGMINPNKTGFQRGFPELQHSDPANRIKIGSYIHLQAVTSCGQALMK